MSVLCIDHSYDQTLQWRSTNKMIGIISGQGRLTANSLEDRQAWAAANEVVDDEEMDTDKIMHDVLTVKAAHLYRRMFGGQAVALPWR